MINATTSLLAGVLLGLIICAILWVASAYCLNEMESYDEPEGYIAQGRSGLCSAWKSTNPGRTVSEPSRGGKVTDGRDMTVGLYGD